tara:strand:- start:2465 stop:2932 length:468 start_codon:yes stop_codon:yes gene_type:complete
MTEATAKVEETETTETVVETRQPEKDDLGRSYATGKKKSSISRVWVMPGNGKITVNGKDVTEYYKRATQVMIVKQPFEVCDRVGQFDVMCTVRGGGLGGQAAAVRHGIAQALQKFEPELRAVLKAEGLLTRDSRRVERKKYGKPKARRSKQFSKR